MGALLEPQLQQLAYEGALHLSYSMLFLTYIKGSLMTDWTAGKSADLNNQVQRTNNPYEAGLWDDMYQSFRQAFADLQEQEKAENILQWGIHMQGDNFDNFTVLYECLTTEAGYDQDSRLCLKFFTDGLPHELYQD